MLDLLQRTTLRRSNDLISRSYEISRFHFPLKPVAFGATGLFTDDINHRVCSRDILPSSLDEKSSITAEIKNSSPKSAAAVIYQVQANLYLGDALLASAAHKVHIFDCSEVAPPLCLGDFGSEYVSRRETIIRKNVFQKVGLMSIEATQPDPFVFGRAGDSEATKILLQVSVQKTYAPFEVAEPDTFQAAITWKLQSSTFISMETMDRQATIRQAACSSSMARLVNTGQGHRLKMIWSDWKRSNLPDPVYSGTITQWTAVHPLWLSVQSSHVLAPTFSLPSISRRYSILLDVAVSGFGRSHAKLKIPVQLIYRSDAACSAGLLEGEPSCLPTEPTQPPSQTLSDRHNVDLPPYLA